MANSFFDSFKNVTVTLILGIFDIHSFLFYKSVFYKNIECKICQILRYFKNKPKLETLKRM